MHIHDNDGIVDLHLTPYTGTADWQNFYLALKNIGYDGDLSFETFRQIQQPFCDRKTIKPWLTLIGTCGKFLKEKIQNK